MKYDTYIANVSSSMRHKMISKTLMAASTRPIILAILSRGKDYGYSIIQKVKDISGCQWVEIAENGERFLAIAKRNFLFLKAWQSGIQYDKLKILLSL
jgi:uncharacterized phage-associated protein